MSKNVTLIDRGGLKFTRCVCGRQDWMVPYRGKELVEVFATCDFCGNAWVIRVYSNGEVFIDEEEA